MKQVKKNREPILVTLKGEPVAMVVPPPAGEKSGEWMGAFRSSGQIVGDIVAPAAEESDWEVLGRQLFRCRDISVLRVTSRAMNKQGCG